MSEPTTAKDLEKLAKQYDKLADKMDRAGMPRSANFDRKKARELRAKGGAR